MRILILPAQKIFVQRSHQQQIHFHPSNEHCYFSIFNIQYRFVFLKLI